MRSLYDWADLPESSTGPEVVRRRIDGHGFELVRVAVKAGTRAARHAHANEQFVQVLSGRGTLETAEGRQAFSAGSVFHFPAEVWHAAVFDEDTILVETNLKSVSA